MLAEIGRFIESPYTAFVAAVILGGIALSGKFSVTATQILLGVALVISIVGLREQPWPVLIGASAMIAGGLVLLAYWFQPDAIPSYAGI